MIFFEGYSKAMYWTPKPKPPLPITTTISYGGRASPPIAEIIIMLNLIENMIDLFDFKDISIGQLLVKTKLRSKDFGSKSSVREVKSIK